MVSMWIILALAVTTIQVVQGKEGSAPDVSDLVEMSEKSIEKRAPCPSKFYRFNPRHTACLGSRNHGTQDGVSAADRKTILDTHNAYRAKQFATNMQKMYWDEELAMIAQKWASNCNYNHDKGDERSIPRRMAVGQNIAMDTYKQKDWTRIMGQWYDEIKDFTFGGTNVFHKVGHYTQMVWAKTPLIGCGYAKCPPNRKITQPWNYFVCNYGPAGNAFDQISTPYKNGPKGSDCMTRSREGLCDCQGRLCMNQGELDVSTCSCKCIDVPWVSKPDCKVECSKAKDTEFCHGAFGPTPCQYSNVPLEYCPKLCKLC